MSDRTQKIDNGTSEQCRDGGVRRDFACETVFIRMTPAVITPLILVFATPNCICHGLGGHMISGNKLLHSFSRVVRERREAALNVIHASANLFSSFYIMHTRTLPDLN